MSFTLDAHPTLPSAITAHLDGLPILCRQYAVVRLELFGSAASANFNENKSDVDLIVDFDDQAPKTFQHYFEFRSGLETLFQRPVDLLEGRTAIKNPYLRAAVNECRIPLYVA